MLDKMFLFNGQNWTANFRQIKVLTFTEKIRLMNIEYVRYKKNIDTTKWIDKKMKARWINKYKKQDGKLNIEN